MLSAAAGEVPEQHPQDVKGSQAVVQVACACKPSAFGKGMAVERDNERWRMRA